MVMGKTPIERAPLLPDRRPQPDFFVCDIFDAAPKSDMASMEHPIFSLSTKPDRRIRRYEHGLNYVEIIPSVIGLATVHDRDVLIFCISQLIAALNEGRAVSKTVRFQALDLLQATNRDTGGKAYVALRASFDRLRGTTISTNIATGDTEQWENFGLIESSKIIRKTRDGRMLDVEITLSDWVFEAIRAKEVLTLNRNYFRLRKPLERRLYELARKHCGVKSEWKIGLELLQKKCGSNSTLFEFRRLIKTIADDDAAHQHMPDYSVSLDDDFVLFQSRGTVPRKRIAEGGTAGPIDARAHEDARAAAPGWDVYHLEQEWREWCGKTKAEPKRPGAHFVKFCKTWYEKRGRP
jgi:hypothetical protein